MISRNVFQIHLNYNQTPVWCATGFSPFVPYPAKRHQLLSDAYADNTRTYRFCSTYDNNPLQKWISTRFDKSQNQWWLTQPTEDTSKTRFAMLRQILSVRWSLNSDIMMIAHIVSAEHTPMCSTHKWRSPTQSTLLEIWTSGLITQWPFSSRRCSRRPFI